MDVIILIKVVPLLICIKDNHPKHSVFPKEYINTVNGCFKQLLLSNPTAVLQIVFSHFFFLQFEMI